MIRVIGFITIINIVNCSNVPCYDLADPFSYQVSKGQTCCDGIDNLDSHDVLFNNKLMFGSYTGMELRLHMGGTAVFAPQGTAAGRFSSMHKTSLEGTPLWENTGLFYNNQKVANLEYVTETIKLGNHYPPTSYKNFMFNTIVLHAVEDFIDQENVTVNHPAIIFEQTCSIVFDSNQALGYDNYIKNRCAVEIVAMPSYTSSTSPILNNIIPFLNKPIFSMFKDDKPMGGGFNVSNVPHALNGGTSTHRQFIYKYYEPVSESTLVPRVMRRGASGTSIVHVPE